MLNFNFNKIFDIIRCCTFKFIIVNNRDNVKITHNTFPTVYANQNLNAASFQNLILNSTRFHEKISPEINISAQKRGK
jgi:light-regulated signal transduction histidine kinase (bacteriophytochrome)